MNELHLFTGDGGGILGGMLLGHTCVCAVELEPHCRRVLLQRQRDGILPRFPIWDDVRTFDGKPWRGRVDVVCGGFPCTDLSFAKTHDSGGRYVLDGLDGERSGLWSEQLRIIRETGASALVENVTALLDGWIGRILRDLATLGYDARWGVFPAASLGANHRRERLFLAAYPKCQRRREEAFFPLRFTSRPLSQTSKREFSRTGLISGAGPWRNGRQIESAILGVDDGVADGMDRLKAAGNGQVPAVAALAWEILK